MTWEEGIIQAFKSATSSPLNANRSEFVAIYHAVYASMLDTSANNTPEEKKDINGLPYKMTSPQHLVYSNSSDLIAYLSLIFALNPEIFDIKEDPAYLNIISAVQSKLKKDSNKSAWAAEIVKAANNAALYNFAPVEIRLENTDLRIKALCPYNTFYDTTVAVDKLGSEGIYAGYHEVVSVPSLYTRLFAIPEKYRTSEAAKLILNINSLKRIMEETADAGLTSELFMDFTSVKTTPESLVGKPLKLANLSNKDFWATQKIGAGGVIKDNTFKLTNEDTNRVSAGHLSLSTYYRRALPQWLNLPEDVYPRKATEDLSSIPVYKCLVLNGRYLLSVEPVNESHGLLPIVAGSLNITSSGTLAPSFARTLIPVQNLDTKLTTARLTAVRKGLQSRIIGDGKYVNEGTLSALDDTGVLILNNDSLSDEPFDIRRAILPLNQDLNHLAALIGTSNDLAASAIRISGNTPQMQGSRTPGNKLAAEADKEIQFSEGRFRIYALIFQQTLLLPLKEIIRTNLIDIASSLYYKDKMTGQSVYLKPSDLDQEVFEFLVSDGLVNYGDRISPDIVIAMFNMVAQIPLLQQTYDIRSLFALLGRAGGLKDVDRIPSPNTAQQELMRSMQASQQSNGVETPASQQDVQNPQGSGQIAENTAQPIV